MKHKTLVRYVNYVMPDYFEVVFGDWKGLQSYTVTIDCDLAIIQKFNKKKKVWEHFGTNVAFKKNDTRKDASRYDFDLILHEAHEGRKL
jgi:hypothetical protein